MGPVKFNDELYVEHLKMDDFSVGEAMSDNHSYMGYYGSQQGKWEAQVRFFKLQLENRKAQVAQEIRSEATGKAPSQGVVDARVQLDPEVQQISKKLILAQEQETQYTNAIKAFTDRGNNARSKNSTQRAEKSNY